MTSAELARQYAEATGIINDLQTSLKRAKERRGEIEGELIDSLAEEGIKSVKVSLPGGGSAHIVGASKTYYSCSVDNMPHLVEQLKMNGLSEITKETVHNQTLNAWAREHLENHGDLPDAIDQLLKRYDTIDIRCRLDDAGQDQLSRRINRELTDQELDRIMDESL